MTRRVAWADELMEAGSHWSGRTDAASLRSWRHSDDWMAPLPAAPGLAQSEATRQVRARVVGTGVEGAIGAERQRGILRREGGAHIAREEVINVGVVLFRRTADISGCRTPRAGRGPPAFLAG